MQEPFCTSAFAWGTPGCTEFTRDVIGTDSTRSVQSVIYIIPRKNGQFRLCRNLLCYSMAMRRFPVMEWYAVYIIPQKKRRCNHFHINSSGFLHKSGAGKRKNGCVLVEQLGRSRSLADFEQLFEDRGKKFRTFPYNNFHMWPCLS